VFDDDPDVFAEIFRHGTELLHHPQTIHNHQVIEVEDAKLGTVTQPGALVRMDATPASIERSAPSLDEHGEELRARTLRKRQRPEAAATTTTDPPLAGVTIVELGTFYAAPFGTTILTDYGARVIKIEQLDGDPMRWIMPFPEAGGIKVLQGKESVAVDLASDEGREIVYELVRHADAVLVSFRAVVGAPRARPRPLLAMRPDLVYPQRTGLRRRRPCGHCPVPRPPSAPAPVSPCAASASPPLRGPTSGRGGEADRAPGRVGGHGRPVRLPASQLGVASALAARSVRTGARRAGQARYRRRVSSRWRVLVEDMVEYDDRPARLMTDPGLHGLSARYRLYETADGWVFLAAPAPSEWDALVSALAPFVDLAADPRFTDEDARRAHDDELADLLAGMFRKQPAGDWENELCAVDVGCLRCATARRRRSCLPMAASGAGLGHRRRAPDHRHPPAADAPGRVLALVDGGEAELAARRAHRLGARRARLRPRSHHGAA
jgi:crotonobetainyl-CoA:carnitine CoA-transferase CaiB-like acyl-CoA transferase